MAIEKKSLNNFLPNGFETQNQEGYKENFSSERISSGYDKDTLEILSGPNLNNFIDKVGKNFNTLNDLLEYFKAMPIASFPVVNASNQLDYKSVNSFFRNVGELVYSTVPLDDDNLHLANGDLLTGTGDNRRFVSYIKGLRTDYPGLFTTESNWQLQVSTYGVCGKYVYDSTNDTLRLPKITGFVEGTIDVSALGDLVQAGLPLDTHTHTGTTGGGSAHSHTRGSMNITGDCWVTGNMANNSVSYNGAFYSKGTYSGETQDDSRMSIPQLAFDASRSWTGSTSAESAHTHTFSTSSTTNTNAIYGNSTKVQPQAIKEYVYIVVGTDAPESQVLTAVYQYKGSVQNYTDLPTDASVGEVYNVVGPDPEGYSGANYAWTGTAWDKLGGTVDLSGYLTIINAANTYATKVSLESKQEYLQEQISQNRADINTLDVGGVIESTPTKLKAAALLATVMDKPKSDADIFNILDAERRSTFDLSKFTVVGSPTITDDGIASGFSSNNYIKTNTALSFSTASSWEIECKFNSGSNWDTDKPLISGLTNQYIGVNINTAKRGRISFGNGSAWFISDTIFSSTFTDNTDYIMRISFTGTNYIVYLNDVQVVNVSSTSKVGDTPILFGVSRGGTSTTSYPFVQDLKQFSVRVNGQEVFNGNKSGIDQIKANDYTVVGSPTITDDGIASNFGLSRYIYTSVSLNNNFITEGSFNIPSTATTVNSCMFVLSNVYTGTDTYNLLFILHRTTGGIIVGAKNNGTSSTISYYTGTNYKDGLDHKYKVVYDGSNIKVYVDDIKIIDIDYDLSAVLPNCNYCLVGAYPGDSLYCMGSLNLNLFKIYVDSNLVYQPTLRIPYNQSKTGCKIVDSYYRDRVQDMYEQFGYTHYYTIGDVPEKYNVQVVGSPTLNAGVLSNTSSSSYAQFSNIDLANKTWKIKGIKVKTSSDFATQRCFLSFKTTYNSVSYNLRLLQDVHERFGFLSYYGSDVPVYTPTQTLDASTWYDIEIEQTATQNIIRYAKTGETLVEYTVSNSTLFPTDSNNILLGLRADATTINLGDALMDLSALEIEVSGNKIVDAYEPVVEDAFTLATHKGGDIIDMYENGANSWERRADLTVEQQGSCTSGTAVTLAKPYKDTNYALSVPYSAKTATGFTPSASGDYIAKGKVVLG